MEDELEARRASIPALDERLPSELEALLLRAKEPREEEAKEEPREGLEKPSRRL